MRWNVLAVCLALLLAASSVAIAQVETPESAADSTSLTVDSTATLEAAADADEVLEPDADEDVTTEEQESRTLSGIEFDGFVVDRTISKIGRDFYDLFYSEWQAPKGASGYSVVISEKVTPRFGTQIIIEVEDQTVFEQFVQPRYDIIEQMAKYGVYYAYMHLVNAEQLKNDLEDQDMEGSGIY